MAEFGELGKWIADSNEALSISLVEPSSAGLKEIAKFNPEFTYTIFGEEQQVFGYTKLDINLRYRANDMRPNLQMKYGEKFKPIGETTAMDVVDMMKTDGCLPEIAFAKAADFESNSQKMTDDWTPPGELHASFEGPDATYEIWKGGLEDPAMKQLNARLQVLVPLFIEGGSFIQDLDDDAEAPSDDDRWTLFLLYRKSKSASDSYKSSYVFAGYSTVYRFFYFQPPSPPPSPQQDWELPTQNLTFSSMPSRTRLSQFIILPPFQSKGLGTRLYETIFKHYYNEASTLEFTIENPNEGFDKIRDVCDLKFLRSLPTFSALKLNEAAVVPHSGSVPSLISGGDVDAIRRASKIAPRQFNRVLEMQIMSQLPESVQPTVEIEVKKPASTKEDRHLERLWQIFAKQRLYRHNREALSQMEHADRVQKLHETLNQVEYGYALILNPSKASEADESASSSGQTNRKRKFDDDDKTSSKKARVDDE